MFHVSFLVKQRVKQLSVDEDLGLPVLKLAWDKNQAVISLSYEEDLVEVLGIMEPNRLGQPNTDLRVRLNMNF